MTTNDDHRHPADAVEDARHRLVNLVLSKKETLADEIVRTFTRDIVDYSALPHLTLTRDVQETAVATVTDLLGSLLENDSSQRDLEEIRRSAARRVHQDVSLPSLLHSYRIWGVKVWQAVLHEADDDLDLRNAALSLVDRIFNYVDRVSALVAQVYLEEAAGAYRARDVLRSDVLESLLVGRQISDGARLDITRLNLTSETSIAVVLVRLNDVSPEQIRVESLKVLNACREKISAHATTVFGVRESDVICLIRIGQQSDRTALVAGVHQVAEQSQSWRVCMGRPHQGIKGIARSFHEAQEAAVVASSQRDRRTATLFSEIILDRILVRSEYADDLIVEFLDPILDYDQQHSTELLDTLRSYLDNNQNISRTASAINVSPNTVAYRIRRIGEIMDQDLTTTSGIVTAALAIRLFDR